MAKQEPSRPREARLRIEKAKSSQAVSLDLSGLGLIAIPKSIAALTNLTSLELRNNQITTLPESIMLLFELKQLDLSGNQIPFIPKSIAALAKLRILRLSGNKITTISESITELKHLKWLSLSGNRLTRIPESIARLTDIRQLDLAGNRITTIPESIARLSGIRQLDLAGNQISAIPNSIATLSKLRVLRLSGNQITAISESIAALKQLKDLSLADNQIKAIPELISLLSGLKRLDLSGNQITTISESISRLSEMSWLYLSDNQIATIPESIAALTKLKSLSLDRNEITAIPESIGALTKLERLDLSGNQIRVIPESISRLPEMRRLNLFGNYIKAIPDSISKLAKLQNLILGNNEITDIPLSLSGLKRLAGLDLSGNPLPDEFMAAAKRGAEAFLRYLKSIDEIHATHPRTVKVVLLGEPLVGKTTLLEALKGNIRPCDPDRKETFGVNVANVDKKNPEDGQDIHLSVWDFAGQHMEHATHQPFLTANAVFLILWNARQGAAAGKRDLWYWLELLRMRVREPKFLLVATHTEQLPLDLNLTEIQRVYRGYQGCFAVELCSLVGFEALEGKVLQLAAASQALKAVWPKGWLPVRDQIRRIGAIRPHMSSDEFKHLIEDQGVRDTQQQKDLAEQLHQLGEILYFHDLEELSRLVILSPGWLSNLIARVVRSSQAQKGRGVLRGWELNELWRSENLSSEVRDHLIRLMDHFDLTYSTVDAGDARIVVEALPYSTPEELERIKLPADQPEMEMIFRFPTLNRHLPPGIPTWAIARAHRLAKPGLGPWRDAAFFEDTDTGSRAQILASDTSKEVRLKVTSDYPPFFLGHMQAILMDTFNRYRQLVPERRLPCRCRPGCTHSFAYEVVVDRRNSGKADITCESGADVLLDSLLTGYTPTTAVGRHAEESERRRSFTALRRAMNEQMEKTCPSVFTLMPSTGFKQLPTFWETFTEKEELDLCLYCEHDSGWHTTPDSIYRFLPKRDWIVKLKKHWTPLIAVTLHVAPLAKAAGSAWNLINVYALGEAAEGLRGENGPALSPLADELGRQEAPQPVDIRTREVLKELIDHLDAESERAQNPHYAGLHPHIVEDGRLLWLCPEHFETYKTK